MPFLTCARKRPKQSMSWKVMVCRFPGHPRAEFTKERLEARVSNLALEARPTVAAQSLTERATPCYTLSSAGLWATIAFSSSNISHWTYSWTIKVPVAVSYAFPWLMAPSTAFVPATLLSPPVAMAGLIKAAHLLTPAQVMVAVWLSELAFLWKT